MVFVEVPPLPNIIAFSLVKLVIITLQRSYFTGSVEVAGFVRRRGGDSAQVRQCLIVTLVSQLHLDVVRPDVSQFVNLNEGDENGLFEDNPRLFQLLVFLVEPSER